ncbi:hypothetical protein [Mammaliicoccus sciuri]|uniref:hypothetical protein n=1 Tax=Mammaliicoccus sciuri TaxID=1296 RepID=UPI003CC5BE85
MENIYKVILLASTLITLIYNFIKWINKERNREEGSTFNIWMESAMISFLFSVLIIPILYLNYILDEINGIILTDLIIIVISLLSFIAIPMSLIIYIIKDKYKEKYAEIIFQDVYKYKKERLNAYKKMDKMQQEIAKRIIENDFTYEEKLDYINDKYKSLPKLHWITKKYNIICSINWICVAMINIIVCFVIFDSIKNQEVIVILNSLAITFVFFVINTINIYNDLRIKYGKLDSTLNKIKPHQNVYKQLLDKNNVKKRNK